MYNIFKNKDEYNVYTSNGTKLKSGDIYIIEDTGAVIFRTNNIDGKLQSYEASNESKTPPNYVSIIVTYDVTSTSKATHLYNLWENSGTGQDVFDSLMMGYMIVDGELKELSEDYLFDTLGEHEVQYILLPDMHVLAYEAFWENKNLKHVKINKNVTTIEYGCFGGCDNASSISFYSETPPDFGDLSGTPEEELYNFKDIFVPANSVETYKSAWSDVADKIKPLS